MKKIAVFASGAGTNADRIISYFNHRDDERDNQTVVAQVSLVVCNNPRAGVLEIAAREDIPVLLIEKDRFFKGDAYVPELKANSIDFVVLAGFLWRLPPALIKYFPGSIINIHPALLPKYGGKGMYGKHVHETVINHQEKESGITIHYVDEMYDHGSVIFQATCPVMEEDNADSLAIRVALLEHEHYAPVIERLILGNHPL